MKLKPREKVEAGRIRYVLLGTNNHDVDHDHFVFGEAVIATGPEILAKGIVRLWRKGILVATLLQRLHQGIAGIGLNQGVHIVGTRQGVHLRLGLRQLPALRRALDGHTVETSPLIGAGVEPLDEALIHCLLAQLLEKAL